MNRSPGRVLALDVGKKRIGLALSDPLGITAQGLPNLVRKNKRSDLEALAHRMYVTPTYRLICPASHGN